MNRMIETKISRSKHREVINYVHVEEKKYSLTENESHETCIKNFNKIDIPFDHIRRLK
jgi:hypothetical protein